MTRTNEQKGYWRGVGKVKKDIANKKENTSWIFSDDLIKRSIAIFGHCLLGYICVVIPLAVLFGIIVGLFTS